MAGIDNNVLYGSNLDFSGGFPVSGEINLNGELLVGATVAPFIRPYVPTGTNGLVVTKGPGTIDFTLAAIPNSALANSSVNIIAGTGLTGGGNVSLGGSVTLNASGGGTVTSVSGTANQVAVATGTTTPVISLIGPYTPATYTTHGVLIGEGTSSIVALAAGSAGQVLQSGGASADPVYSTATYPATAGTSGNVLTSDGTNWTSSTPTPVYQVATGTLTNSQIKNLHGTPVQIVAPPGSGKSVVIVLAFGKLSFGSNVFTAGAAQVIGVSYGTSFTIGNLLNNAALTSNSSVVSQSNGAFQNLSYSTANNAAINLYNPIATEITGNAANDNTIPYYVVYYIVTI